MSASWRLRYVWRDSVKFFRETFNKRAIKPFYVFILGLTLLLYIILFHFSVNIPLSFANPLNLREEKLYGEAKTMHRKITVMVQVKSTLVKAANYLLD